MARKILAIFSFIAIVGGSLAASRRSDADLLTRVGYTTAGKVTAAMPDRELVAGPLAKVQFVALTSVEERVRVRFRTDAALEGCQITVTSASGVVALRGKAETTSQRERAVHLAQTTVGVTRVTQEIAVPVDR